MKEKIFVYILLSKKDGRFYIGMTRDVERRLKQHNSDRVLSTKSRYPFELVHVEECEDRVQAREREKYWKSGTGREKILKGIWR